MFNFCPADTKLVIQKPNGKLFTLHLMNYQYNLLAIKKMIEDREFIQIDQQSLSYCGEEMTYDRQGIDIYHRYFHQKYGRCMYISSIQLKLK